MKNIIIGIVILFALAAGCCYAQGSFSDVPTDHWAYDAVNKLQADGVVIGYPDGTFSGKRPLTRFEFAAALARAIPVIEQRVAESVKTQAGPQGPAGPAGPQGPAGPAGAPGSGINEADFKALQQLVNEFRDELAGLGVDVDALKRDVAALAARTAILEKYMNKWGWGVDAMVVGVATQTSGSNGAGITTIDLDSRPLQPRGLASGKLINSISMLRDFDLNLNASLSPSMSTNFDIDFGNYIPAYLGGIVTDYVGTERVTQTRTPAPNFATTGVARANTDFFFPYYAYVTAGLGKGNLKLGRMPMQLTPYTLKLIDVDSYTVNNKTDSGNYPLDGGMINWKFGPVAAMGFAAKTDQNTVLGNGLISQPTAGLYKSFPTFYTVGGALVGGGHAAGGLSVTNQVAGGRLSVGTPFKGTLGATYMMIDGPANAAVLYDRVDVWGADLNAVVAHFPIAIEYAQSTTKDDAPVGIAAPDIDSNNAAFDGKIGWGTGKFNLNLGYKDIGNNFGAPGYWDKIGRWTNPTNVKGPYAHITYGLMPSVSLVANGEFLKGKKTIGVLPAVINDTDDKVWKAEGGLKWGFASASNLNLGVEYVNWDPSGAGTETKESYITLGLGHQLNPSTGLSVSYQIIDYKAGSVAANTPYGGASGKGGVAVAEVKTKF